MPLATPEILYGAHATPGLFGGNILASRGELLGNSYDAAIDDLGVTTLRFPGGSLTEYLFDIRNPDAPTAYDPRYGTTEDMIGLTEFMTFAEVNNHPVTIVIPTQTQLGDQMDANGDHFPDIQEGALRTFVQDVASGAYGNAEVRAFEVGNEYWGSGLMTANEYGRLAAEMSTIIDDALSEIGVNDIDIVVQKGNNYATSRLSDDYAGVPTEDAIEDINAAYGLTLGDEAVFQSGQIDWTYVNNAIVLNHFDTDAERAAIDGVVAHVYSRGAENPNSRTFDLNNINETWRAEVPELDVYVTEWNLKSTDSLNAERDYGLFQAHEMLNMVEEFMRLDVTEANVWPLIQNTGNALSNGFRYDEATVGGEMFSLMSETLPGKTLLDFSPGADTSTEQQVGDVAVHAFAGERELALYLVNTDRTDATMTDVDISGLVRSFGDADITRLGVTSGAAPGSNRSGAQIEDLPSDRVIDGGFIEADLMPGEILQVVFSDVTPAEAFREAWEIANDTSNEGALHNPLTPPAPDAAPDTGDADDPVLPTIPIDENFEDPDDPEESALIAEASSLGGVGYALLPLFLLLGLAGFGG